MEVAGLTDLDWSVPWLAPLAEIGRPIAASCDWRTALNQAAGAAGACNASGGRIAFCDAELAADEPYETFIARTGRVPTRNNPHDFFNALMFVHFPRAKAQLNRLQSQAIARDGIRAVRGSVRDAATLIDENAVLLVTERADVVELLRDHDWPALFQSGRAEWNREVGVLAFGHALLEKLTQPYKAITAHALHLALSPRSRLEEIDRCMAGALDDRLSPFALMPLPVLGIPGWWWQNENPDFYSDRTVFRPAKMRRDRKAEKDL